MFLSKENIQKIKDTVDLKELVSEYTVLNKESCGWSGKCPFPNHNDDTPSFFIKQDKNKEYWHCFGCDTHGDCIDFIKNMYPDKTWTDAVLFLSNKYKIPLNNKYEKEYKRNKLLANKYKKDIDNKALYYLYSRGLSNEEINKWTIGYDKITDRIVFPLYDRFNNIIGFNKRVINNSKEQKYKNSKTSDIFNKSSYLYGLNNINKDTKYIIITEGVMDVILATKYNLNNVVCTLGTALTQQHVPILKQLNKEIIILYDGDKKGKESIIKAANLLLENNLYCKTVFLPNNYDLADIALEYRYNLKSYIESETYTYGYYNAKNIINNYNKELYELKLKYQPLLDNTIKMVPDKEKNTIRYFLENEIGLKASD